MGQQRHKDNEYRKEGQYQLQTLNMIALGNMQYGLFKLNMPFFDGRQGGTTGGGKKNENGKRHQINLTIFTGIYKNIYYINGVPQFSKEKRERKGLPSQETLTSKHMNERPS